MIDYLIKNWGIEKDMALDAYDVGIKTYTTDGSVSTNAIQNHIADTKLTGLKVRDDITPSMIADFSLLSEAKKELGITP
ncbi:MAG: hypothetical protein Q8Q41_00150 [bacterium]|nr:hypothetical protein [bacterium]